jgi:glycosyltransferase involved in cell wall biosynthesis
VARGGGQPAMTRISVVVCTRGRPTLLPRALTAMAAAVAEVPGTEVLIVQQGPGDSSTMAAAAGLDARVILDDGVGAARARNIGIRHASGDSVAFTDDDCEVPRSWLVDHLAALDDPAVTASFGVVEGLSRAPGADPVAEKYLHEGDTVPWLIGHSSNMVVRRDALIRAGGFDERLGPGSRRSLIGEDADLIVRLLEQGAVCASGVGTPVQHMEWRTEKEHRVVLRRYEAGSGAWIGAALRRNGVAARRHLRSRLHVVRQRVQLNLKERDITAALSAVWSLVKGLTFGLAFRPWPGPLTGVSPAPGDTPPGEQRPPDPT